jgi:hypothetical protein
MAPFFLQPSDHVKGQDGAADLFGFPDDFSCLERRQAVLDGAEVSPF